MQKIRNFVLVGLVLATAGIFAANKTTQPNKEAVVDELVNKLIKAMKFTDMTEQMLKALTNRDLNQNETAIVCIVEAKTNEYFSSLTFKEKIKSVYTKYYTQAELQQLVDFYDSELGKKTLDLTPKITTELYASMSSDLTTLMTEVAAEVSQLSLDKQSKVAVTA